MDLYEYISRRKSCRSYVGRPLPGERLDEIRGAIDGFTPLYPDVPLDCRFVSKTKGLFNADAPHYLIVSGSGKEGELENAGFIYQQLVLWFDAHDLGCVWLGNAKDAQADKTGRDIITIAFGQTPETPHRSEAEFKRRPIAEITNAPEDACLKAVSLAPSGMNLQPWYMEKAADKILVYSQPPKAPYSLLYKLTDLDMGIALCHYALACAHFGKSFAFRRSSEGPDKKGYRMFGEITAD